MTNLKDLFFNKWGPIRPLFLVLTGSYNNQYHRSISSGEKLWWFQWISSSVITGHKNDINDNHSFSISNRRHLALYSDNTFWILSSQIDFKILSQWQLISGGIKNSSDYKNDIVRSLSFLTKPLATTKSDKCRHWFS